MMEGSAKEIPEADFLAAMKRAHEEVVKIIDLQIEMRRSLGKPDKDIHDKEEDPEKMASSAASRATSSLPRSSSTASPSAKAPSTRFATSRRRLSGKVRQGRGRQVGR